MALELELMAGVITMPVGAAYCSLNVAGAVVGMVGKLIFWFVLASCKLPVVVKLELATLVPLTVRLETEYMLTVWAAPPAFGVAVSVVKAGLPAAAAVPVSA